MTASSKQSAHRKLRVKITDEVVIKKYKTRMVDGKRVQDEEPYEVKKVESESLTSTGREKLIEHLIGGFDDDFLDDEDTRLRIMNGGSQQKVLTVLDGQVGISTSPPRGFWRFQDLSSDGYAVTTMQLWYNHGGAGQYHFSTANISDTKATDENWEIEYRQNVAGADGTSFVNAGMASWMQRAQGGGLAWNTANTKLQPFGGTASGTVNATSVTKVGTTQWRAVFSSAPGNQNGTWPEARIRRESAGTILREGDCQASGSCGTKAASDTWEYTYTVTID